MKQTTLSQRLLSFVLAFVMVFAMVPVQAFAAEFEGEITAPETAETVAATTENTEPSTENTVETEAIFHEIALETTETTETTETAEAETTAPVETEEVVEEDLLFADAPAAKATVPNYIQSVGFGWGRTASNAKKVLTNAGFTVINMDLNEDAGGKYVYMGYKTTTDPSQALADLFFLYRHNDSTPPSSIRLEDGRTATLINNTSDGVVDLNEGAGGSYVYAYEVRTLAEVRGPLTRIDVVTDTSMGNHFRYIDEQGRIYNYADLNAGTGDQAIYVRFETYQAQPAATFYYLNDDGNRSEVVYSKRAFSHLEEVSNIPYYIANTGRVQGWRNDDLAAPATMAFRDAKWTAMSEGDAVKFRAIYLNAVTLSYNANGGTNAPAQQSIDQYINPGSVSISKSSVTFTVSSAAPVHHEKCALLGWSTSSSATSADYVGGASITTKEPVTLYAVWKDHDGSRINYVNNGDNHSYTMSCCGKTYTESHSDGNGDNLCDLCGASLSAPAFSSGVYQISNKVELIWFMQYVNQGNKGANGVLLNDIDMGGYEWTPIASTASYHEKGSSVTDTGYSGTFDGAGHVIRNFTVSGGAGDGSSGSSGNVRSYGLFGTVSGTVKNLGIDGYTFNVGTADCRAGAIVGQLVSGGEISGCYVVNSSVLTGTRIAGAIAGCNYGGTIEGCYAYNCQVTGHSRCAAVVGDCQDDGGAKAGTVINCYADKNPVGSQNAGGDYVKNCGTLSAAQFASGEATWLLNGGSSYGTWTQACGIGLPGYGGLTVYQVLRCDEKTIAYSNAPDSPQAHDYVDLVCSFCGKVSPDAVAQVTIGEVVSYYADPNAAVQAVKSCTEADNAGVKLLKDVNLGENNLSIRGGVFTLDLNGCKLSSDNASSGAVYIEGNSVVTVQNGTVSGDPSCFYILSSTVKLENVSMVDAGESIMVFNDAVAEVRDCTMNGGVYVRNGTVDIYGGSITSVYEELDLDSATVRLHEGVTFPGGISVSGTTLNAVLAEGMAYWSEDAMLAPAEDATGITDKGDIAVMAACAHAEGEKNYVNNGVDHTYTYTCCNLTVTEAHDYGTTLVCACGAISPEAVALVTIGGNVTGYADPNAAVQAVISCTEADNAGVKLLKDVDLGENKLSIRGGVFTLDLNGCKLSSDARSQGAVYIDRNSVVTVKNGTVSGNGGCFQIEEGNVKLEKVTMVGEYEAIYVDGTAVVEVRDCTMSGYVFVNGGTVDIYGGSITASDYDIDYRGGTVTLHEGVIFPGGISVSGTTLNAVLAEGMAYWCEDAMLAPGAEETEITGKGDITVKAACAHAEGEKNYVNNGVDHTYTYTCCNLTVTEAHDYGTTLVCACGAISPDAVAQVTIGEVVSYYADPNAAAQAVKSCTEADNAGVKLLKDVDLGGIELSIRGGVFTLDLNGCKLSSDEDSGGAVYIDGTSVVTVKNGTVSGKNSCFQIEEGNVKLEKVTMVGEYQAIYVNRTSVVEVRDCTMDAEVYANGGTVDIYGGSITGRYYDIDYIGGTVTLHEGVTFPGGIIVADTTLNAVLAEGMAYWCEDAMLAPAEDAIKITDKGDITVKAACAHANGGKNYVNNGDDHTYTYTCCGLAVTEPHDYGTTLVCACGAISPEAVALVTIGGNVTGYADPNAAVQAVKSCTEADNAGVKLLKDVDLGENNLPIRGGVFTLDLNGCKLSSDSRSQGAVYIDGNSVVTVKNGTISGKNSCFQILDCTVKLEKVTMVDANRSIGAHGTSVVEVRDCTMDAEVYANGGTVDIYGGSITDSDYDIDCRGGTVTLHEGVTFPGGIIVSDTTLNAVLAEGMAYWCEDAMLAPAEDATKITDKGDITVKSACAHAEGEKNYVNNGDDHTYTYTCCGLAVTEPHDYGTTLVCACGAISPEAVALVTIGGNVTGYADPNAAVQAVISCTEADNAGVKLLKDVDLGGIDLSIRGGVFTLDLNGCKLSSDDASSGAVYIDGNSVVTVKNGTVSGKNSCFHIFDCTVKLEKVTMVDAYSSIGAHGTSVVEVRDCTMSAYVIVYGGTVDIYGGSITASDYDIDYRGGTVTLHEGVTFPGGIIVSATTLNAVLAEGLTYVAQSGALYIADDATSITDKGDITVVKDTYGPKVINTEINRNSQETATVHLTVNEDGEYYYALSNGLSVPSIDTSVPGIPYTGGSITIDVSGLDEGTWEIVVCLKDTHGNVSTVTEQIPEYEEATTVDLNLYLKAVDEDGNEIQSELDAMLNGGNWVGTWMMAYSQPYVVNIGENVLSDWGYYPEGYFCPDYDITFNAARNGAITITSGNASVEVVDGMTFIVVTLVSVDSLYPVVPENGWPIWVAGVVVTEDNCDDILGDGTVSYDPENNTLTFEDAEITTDFNVLRSKMPLTVTIKGENSFESEQDCGFSFIYEQGEVVINGTGSMQMYSENEAIWVEGLDHKLTLSGSVDIVLDANNDEGIYMYAEKAALVIQDDVTLKIGSGSNKLAEEALYIDTEYEGSVLIEDNAKVTIFTSDEEGIYVGGYDQLLTITGGTVYIEADEEAIDVGTVNISGGTVTAIGGEGNEGIYADVLNISGGSILAGTIYAEDEAGDGVEADEITITGGSLRVSRGGLIASTLDANGVGIAGTITLGEGMIIAEPEGGVLDEYDLSETEGIVLTVVDSDGFFADALVITDGETPVPKQPEVWLAGVGMKDGEYLAVGDDFTTTTKPTEGGYAYYKDGVLTLNNFTYTGEGYWYDTEGEYVSALYAERDLSIVLKGDSSLNNTLEDYYTCCVLIIGDLTISGTGSLITSGDEYGMWVEGIMTINSGYVIVDARYYDGLYIYGKLIINGGTLESLDGGMYVDQYDPELGWISGEVILGEGVSVVEPEGGSIYSDESYTYVVDADGAFAHAFVITDGKEPGTEYSGWTELEGDWYYFDPETGEAVTGLSRVPYPAVEINGNTYTPDQETLDYCANKGIEFIDAEEAWFVFDEDGKFQSDLNGFCGTDKWAVNGMLTWHPGLVESDGAYYYFIGDTEKGGNILVNGFVNVTRTNGIVSETGTYYFDSQTNELCAYTGIQEVEGELYYFTEGYRLAEGAGLVKVEDDYIYVRSNGKLVVNAEYYVPANELGIVEGMYQFDENGLMIIPEVDPVKDGIYWENDAWFYYQDGVLAYGLGLVEITEVWHDGETETGTEMTGIVYVRSNGSLAQGNYYVTNVDNYTGSLDIPSGTKLRFGNYGTLAYYNHGIVAENDSLYYYQYNELVYGAGLIEIDGSYYYVRSNGEVVHDRYYWITNTNETGVAAKNYYFNSEGVLQNPEMVADQRNGIVEVDGVLYYYENGTIAYGAGVVKRSDEKGEFYIYVRSNGQLATGKYWPTATNGYDLTGLLDWGMDGKLYI